VAAQIGHGETDPDNRVFVPAGVRIAVSCPLDTERFFVFSNTNPPVSSVRRLVPLLVAAVALLVATPGASAATRYVPTQYPSLAAAYNAAQPGDVIELGAGAHGDQDVPGGSKAVTFKGVPGAKVRTLENSAANVTYDGIEVDAGFAKTAGFQNHGAENVTFKNAAIGNVADEKGALVSGTNFTFDNVLFHDAIMTPGGEASGVHMECVYAIVVPGMTVRNSVFRDCSVMDLFFTYGTWWSPLPPPYGGVTLENNVFAHPERISNTGWHYYGLYVGMTANGGGTFDNWVVRNNTFEGDARVEKSSGTGSRWVGNLGSWDCISGVTYRNNVGKKCGANDKAVSPAASNATRTAAFNWVNPGAVDFRLNSGSPAIDAADPNDAPKLDRDGLQRDPRPDAGALEYGAKPPTGNGAPYPPGSTPTRSGRPLITARLLRKKICRRARRGCKMTARLRIKTASAVSVTVRVLRLRKGKGPRVRRAFQVHVPAAKTVRIRARNLRPGRYRVVALTKDAAGTVTGRQAFKLRVRR
jgi:hypothetical protein